MSEEWRSDEIRGGAAAAALAWMNGRFLPQQQAAIPLHDAGFVWGATVTDLCRTVGHRLYRWADHLERFRESCRAAHVPLRVSAVELTALAEQLVSHNAPLLASGHDLALVALATPGPIGYYLGQDTAAGEGEPTLLLHTFPLPFARYRRYFTEGARLIVPEVRHVPADSVDPRIKQRSRMHWWLAEQQVRAADPLASALLLSREGFVTETAAANFLAVIGGTVLRPPRGTVLEGVSMRVVEELCATLAIPFAERALTLAECLAADEAMLASTTFCLAGVSRLQGQPLPWPGPIYQRLLAAWGAEIGLDIAGQVISG